MTARPVMLIAGEISGDMHAARLVRELRARRPDLAFFGIGGPALRQAGMETVADIKDMAVLGLSEVLWKYFFFRNVFNRVLRLARERRPQAVILVDYPGFNLRLAKRLRAMGLKGLYYVCPQVWAWNRGRIPRMARDVDRLMAIFPFEKEVFSGSRLRVDFVGHPLRESADETLAEQAPDLPWHGSPRLAILPGSRRHEIRRILPPLWAAAGILARRNPGLGVIVATPSDDISGDVLRRIADLPPGPPRHAVISGCARQILRQADAALIASGTATLDAAFMRCPMVIAYRVSWLTYLPGRMLIRVPFLGMVNVLARRRICPEFIQHNARPGSIADAAEPLLSDTPERRTMLAELDKIVASLGPAGCAGRAADVVMEELA